MGVDADRELIRAAVVAMVPPSVRPWSVDVEMDERFGTWSVTLAHEASSGLGIDGLDADVRAAVDLMSACSLDPKVNCGGVASTGSRTPGGGAGSRDPPPRSPALDF